MKEHCTGLMLSTKGLLDRCRTASSIDLSDDDQPDERKNLNEGQAVAGWKEHTWSTFIARAEEEEVEPPQGKVLLSTFQRDKFVHFFYHVLDVNRDHVISQEDFDDLNDRVRHYMDWSINNINYLTLNEVHSLFIQYFLTQAPKFVPKDDGFDFCDFKGPGEEEEEEDSVPEKSSVSIEEWVEVWGETVGKARKMDDLPMWLQYYPKTLFDTINRSGSGVVSKKELKLFYTAFLDAGKMEEEALVLLTDRSYSAMTSNGEVQLNFHMYKLSFLNFLLGKQPNGPGQWIFGEVERSSEEGTSFEIDYKALVSNGEEREIFSQEKLEEKSNRKSIIV